MTTIRIVVADDHPVLREGFKNLLNAQENMQVVGTAGDCAAAAALIAEHKPDVAVLDIEMPPERKNGLDVAIEAVRQNPDLGIVILSQYNRPSLFNELVTARKHPYRSGYLLKDSPVQEVLQAIQAVADGWFYIDKRVRTGAEQLCEALTEREKQVWELVGLGLSTAEIARRLSISPRTCETHLGALYGKLGLSAPGKDKSQRVMAALMWYGVDVDLAAQVQRE